MKMGLILISLFLIVLLVPASGASGSQSLHFAEEYSEDLIIIRQVEPGDYQSKMMYIESLRFDLSDMQAYLGKGGIRISGWESVSAREAADRMQAEGVGVSLLIRGRYLASAELTPLLGAPYRLFRIKASEGTYPVALMDGDTDIAGRRGAWRKTTAQGPLQDTFHFDINRPDEPLLISFGDSISLSRDFRELHLDGSISRQQASSLLSAAGFTYEIVKQFEAPDKIVSSGFHGILTLPSKIREPAFKQWLSQHGRHATIRRFGSISAVTEFTSAMRTLDAATLDATPLDLTPVQGKKQPAPSAETRHVVMPKEPVDLSGLQPDSCEHFESVAGRQSTRVAFVIGNGSYHPAIGWLENPPLDAVAIKSMFLGLGFDVFLTREAAKETILSCLAGLLADYAEVNLAVLHFSGHGVQVDDQNYLVPIDAEPGNGFEENLLSFGDLIQPLRRLSRTTLIFLDACRNNPFEDDGQDGLSALGSTPLNDSIDPEKNSFAVIYSTAADMVAEDGIIGERSPFTNALLSELPKQGVSIQEALANVTLAVGHATEWRQVPFLRSSLRQVLFLNGTKTFEEIVESSRLRASDAAIALQRGNIEEARKHAALAMPMGATTEQLEADFREALEVFESLAFARITNFDYDRAGITSVLSEEHNLAALVGPAEGARESVDVFRVSDGSFLGAVPFFSEYGLYDQTQLAESASGLVAIANQKGKVTILNTATKERSVIELIPSDLNDRHGAYEVEHLEFSPSGSRLLVKSRSAGVMVFDVASGNKVIDLKTLTIGTEEINDSHFHTTTHFSFVDEVTLCFSATRLQNTTRPSPDRWSFIAIGHYDIFRHKISNLTWSTEPLSLQSFKCSPDGQHALISVTPTLPDRDHPNWSTRTHGLLDLRTGGFIVSELLTNGSAHLSKSGDRVAFVDTDSVRLFDVNIMRYLDLPRSQDLIHLTYSKNYVSFKTEFDATNRIRSKVTDESLFELDLSAQDIIDRVLQQIPMGELESLSAQRLVVQPR